MLSQHPFERWSASGRRTAAGACAAAAAVLGGFLLVYGRPLGVAEAPRGLVAFELAPDAARAAAVLAAWGEDGRRRLLVMELVDYPFLLSYGAGLSLAALMGAKAERWPRAARAAAWAATAAAALDAAENALGLGVLAGRHGLQPAQAACAAAKFALVAAALAWAAATPFIPARRD